jgi:hypothetical protein
MNRCSWLLFASMLLSACTISDAPPEAPPDEPPGSCEVDDDCLTGAECENAWCRNGTCRVGTPTGFPCGADGMCVERRCIEL